jgi:antitoxin (DNA-binding transcriptional repressor) of toxin-antitoxin stability system
MRTVTPDDLASNIDHYLAEVASGEVFLIVVQGRQVARLAHDPQMAPALADAVAKGWVRLPQPGARWLTTDEMPTHPGGGMPASEMVIEDRR